MLFCLEEVVHNGKGRIDRDCLTGRLSTISECCRCVEYTALNFSLISLAIYLNLFLYYALRPERVRRRGRPIHYRALVFLHMCDCTRQKTMTRKGDLSMKDSARLFHFLLSRDFD